MGFVKNKIILVVDDEQEICDLFAFALENDGFKVITANDGNKAMEILMTINIDLVILDMVIPGKSGYEIIRALQTEEYRNIPIIATSGRFFEDTLKKMLQVESNVKECLSKPTNINLLIKDVNMLLGTVPKDKIEILEKSRISTREIKTKEEEEAGDLFWPVIYVDNKKIRKEPRIQTDLPVDIYETNFIKFLGSGRITDYSSGGVALETETILDDNQEICMRIIVTVQSYDIFGTIVYKRQIKDKLTKYGIKFTRYNPEEKEQIKSLFEKLSKNRPI